MPPAPCSLPTPPAAPRKTSHGEDSDQLTDLFATLFGARSTVGGTHTHTCPVTISAQVKFPNMTLSGGNVWLLPSCVDTTNGLQTCVILKQPHIHAQLLHYLESVFGCPYTGGVCRSQQHEF